MNVRAMNDRIEKVGVYAQTMADRYLSARFKLAIFNRLTEKDITDRVNNSHGAHAHNALALTLYLDIVRDVCAFVLDADPRAPSLMNIWSLLQLDELRAVLREKAARPDDHIIMHRGLSATERAAHLAELKQEDVQRKGNQFDETYANVAKQIPAIRESELANVLLRTRDKSIAHYEMRGTEDGLRMFDPSDAGLTWGSLTKFVALLDQTLWDVVLLATWGSYYEEKYDEIHRTYANDLFARLMAQPAAREA